MVNDFEEIKGRLDIRAVIMDVAGIAMKGPHLESCPFCGGHECFSFPNELAYKCFQCDEPSGGDVFTFLQRYENLTPAESLARAAAIAGYKLKAKPVPGQKPVPGAELTVKDRIFAEAADYYHKSAFDGPGRDYHMVTRSHVERTVSMLKAGWSDGKLLEALKDKYSIEDLLASGLICKRTKNGVVEVVEDFFFGGLAIYPHFCQGRVIHFTCKDPLKKYKLQLKKEFRGPEWCCLNQDVFYKRGEVVVVEGEHDLSSIFDIGVFSVAGLIGNPADIRVKAMAAHCSGRHVYLCLDADGAGQKVTRKLSSAFTAEGAIVRVMAFDGPAKDIDEYLNAFQGDRHKEFKRLQEESTDVIAWEISLAAKLDGLEEKYKHLESHGVFALASELGGLEREIFLDKIVKLGFTPKSALEALEKENNLLDLLQEYYGKLSEKEKPDAHRMAQIVYNWFGLNGRGKFFKTEEGKVYLFYHRKIYEIGDNLDFNTLMGKITLLAAIEAPGKQVWYWLKNFCNERGDMVSVMTWLHTKRETDSIFVNLNSPRNTLIKLAPGRDPEEVPNGTNPDGVLLSSSSKIAPFAYNPTATEGEAFDALKMLFFNNLSCEKESRYLLLSWLIYIFFLDFNKTKGLLKCTGAAASGKTTAASLLSTIIYGEDFVGQSSVASSISEGARDPIVFQDNVENKDLHRGLINFLLTGANTGPRTKRKAGSDTETVTEKIKALIIVTAIEPFPGHLPELISRTYEVIFDSKFHSPGFVEDDALRGLVKKRNVIISGLLKLVSKSILPKISGRSAWLAVLQKEFPGGHNKSRTNEFLSTLMIIVEEVLKHIPYYEVGHPLHGEGGDATALLKNWVMAQNALASEIGTSSNNILNLLDNFMRVVEADMNKRTESELPLAYHPAWPAEEGYPDGRQVHVHFHPVYLLEVTKTKVEEVVGIIDDEGTRGTVRRKFYQFDVTAAALHDIFNKYSRETGTKNPFDNATALGCRIANDIKFIQKGGWSLIGKDGAMHLKFVQGKKIYRFRKEVIFN